MTGLTIKVEPIRSVWYMPDDNQKNTEVVRWRIASRPHVWRPPTDVFEVEEAIIVRVEVAGMREEDFAISLEDRFLVIRGTRSDSPERRAYHQMEIPFGEFSTEVELSSSVITEKIEAIYKDGFLKITLPKAHPQHVHVAD